MFEKKSCVSKSVPVSRVLAIAAADDDDDDVYVDNYEFMWIVMTAHILMMSRLDKYEDWVGE